MPARKARTVGELFNEYIGQILNEGGLGYALSGQQEKNSLLKYRGHLDIYFSEIEGDKRTFTCDRSVFKWSLL